MIEMKLENLRSPQFTQAIQKLMRTSGFEPKVAYHIGRIGALLETEIRAANEGHDKLLKEWANLKNENGQSFWEVPEEKKDAWAEANKNFHQAVIQIPKRKLQLIEIEIAALTPMDYLALEPLIGELELKSIQGGLDEISKQEKSSEKENSH